MGLPGCASYVAAKHAVVGFSEALRWEIAPTGVGVSVVGPGLVQTNIARGVTHGESTVEAMEKFGGTPEELARRIVVAIRKDRARVLYGTEPWAFQTLRRVSPRLHDAVGKKIAAALMTQGLQSREAQERAAAEAQSAPNSVQPLVQSSPPGSKAPM